MAPGPPARRPVQRQCQRSLRYRRRPTRCHRASFGRLSPLQQQVDAELAQAETPAAISAAERFSVPAPGVSTAYPSVPMADRGDPGAYAIAFTTELLDTNFATQSRDELLSWAEYEESPNTLPGVPASVAGKALVLSLADPDLPGGSPSPVPSAPQWVCRRPERPEPERHRRASRDRPRLDADRSRKDGSPATP